MLNLTNSRLKNYDTGRSEGEKVREAMTKAFWDEEIGICDYITLRKHFRKSFTWKFFHHFRCTLEEGILTGRKFDEFDGCGENPSN